MTPNVMPGSGALCVHLGEVEFVGSAGESAQLSWTDNISVSLNGVPITTSTCVVGSEDAVEVTFVNLDPHCTYTPLVSPDRMQAALKLQWTPGYTCELRDAKPAPHLLLEEIRVKVNAGRANKAEALSVLHNAGITHGIDADAVQVALDSPGRTVVVAQGQLPGDGTDGTIEPLVDFVKNRMDGVSAGTAVMRWCLPKRGESGYTVLGVELEAAERCAVPLMLGGNVTYDQSSELVVATIDGLVEFDESELALDIVDTLVLDSVDAYCGDIDTFAHVDVRGNVEPGRTVKSKHSIRIGGGVEKATLESGDSMSIAGALINSVVRAGGDRAVAASVFDGIEDTPTCLRRAQKRSLELRERAAERGQEISYGLSIQLLVEKYYRHVPGRLQEAAHKLQHAGSEYEDVAHQFLEWKRGIATAAINNLTPEQFEEICQSLEAMVDAMKHALERTANLRIAYAQASEIEVTGKMTITGKGLVNSKVVAWGGIVATDVRTMIRGGSIASHGPIEVRELGSPGGAALPIQLAAGATLSAFKVYSGTFITGPALHHRFIADRGHVTVKFTDAGPHVESLAA